MWIVQVIVVFSSPKAKTLSKPEPVQTGIKFCPQGVPLSTGFTVIIIIIVVPESDSHLKHCTENGHKYPQNE